MSNDQTTENEGAMAKALTEVLVWTLRQLPPIEEQLDATGFTISPVNDCLVELRNALTELLEQDPQFLITKLPRRSTL